MAINFNALPEAGIKPPSPTRLFIYMFIWAGLFMMLVLIVYVITGNKDISQSPLIPAVAIVGICVYIIRSIKQFIRSSNHQQRVMQKFAADNAWGFTGSMGVADPSLVPPHEYLAYDAARLLYRIDGIYDAVPFTLYAYQGALKTIAPGYTVGYETILRMNRGQLLPEGREAGTSTIELIGSTTYVSSRFNLMYRQELINLFKSANLF